MKRKSIFLVIAIVVIAALALVGCNKKSESNSTSYPAFNFDNDGSSTQGGGGSGTGFPPSNVLAEYGFSMIGAPKNVTDVTYDVGIGVLEILFNVGSGTTSIDPEVENWFASNNWTRNSDLDVNNNFRYNLTYEQENFSKATYNRDKESGECQITVIQ